MTDAPTHTEQTFVENGFGTVTSRRVVYFRQKAGLAGAPEKTYRSST
jgi:hypothetical protein